jgi:hypothetical protein
MKRTSINSDTDIIEMLDTLGYLLNGVEIWTRVAKGFDANAFDAFAHPGFEGWKPGESPCEMFPGALIQRLVDEGFVKPVIRSEADSPINDLLFIELEPKGERWYLREYPRWQASLHHKLPASPDAV